MDGADGVPGTNGPRGLKGEMVRRLRSSFLHCVYVVCWCALYRVQQAHPVMTVWMETKGPWAKKENL